MNFYSVLFGQRRVFLSKVPASLPSRMFCEQNFKYDVPKYTKINAWDSNNSNLKNLGKILSSKRDRRKSDSIVLEGVRIIKDAIDQGFDPSVIVFSREKLLWQLELPKKASTKLFHIPYNNIKLWTDLTTSPGIMAAFSKDEITNNVKAQSSLPLTLVCDNIRQPDNLGSVLRVAAAAGAREVLLTPGCTNAWAPKVVRAGAGAHFHVPIVEDVEWQNIQHNWPMVALADMNINETVMNPETHDETLDSLDLQFQEEGMSKAFKNEELCQKYRSLPPRTLDYTDFHLEPGYNEALVIVGGETEGVSDEAYMYCHRHNGVRLHIPLRNVINSLSVVSASSIILFKVQEALLREKKAGVIYNT